MKKETAGQLSKKAASDKTKYNSIEVGHALVDSIPHQLRIAIDNYKDIIDEKEFCVVMIIAKDPLIFNLQRRKFYCYPYLPSPRPNQSVFLYNKAKDTITHRLWVLPCAEVMAELSSIGYVDAKYRTMQAWSIAFFKGRFWEYVRYDQKIDMLSELEFIELHREELIKAGCKIPDVRFTDPFDFEKVKIEHINDTKTALADENLF